MRQVPGSNPPALGIVGDGRLARHFLHYLTLLGLPVRTWSRRTTAAPPSVALDGCRTVLLLVRDEAIESIVRAWPDARAPRLVHCAGGVRLPGVPVVHPLMTFGPGVYDLATYRQIPFILDADGPSLPELLPGLPNPWFRIPPDQRAYYHALCVMAGNFTTLLWQALFDGFADRLGLPASAAHPYLRRVLQNLLTGPGGALTGPLSRRDEGTIAANLRALDGHPYQAVYSAFVRAHEHRS